MQLRLKALRDVRWPIVGGLSDVQVWAEEGAPISQNAVDAVRWLTDLDSSIVDDLALQTVRYLQWCWPPLEVLRQDPEWLSQAQVNVLDESRPLSLFEHLTPEAIVVGGYGWSPL